MRITNINSNNYQNQPNFKAKVEVNLGKDFLKHIKGFDPAPCANSCQRVIDGIKFLKIVGATIGNDSDIITIKGGLNSWPEGVLDIFYNGQKKSRTYLPEDIVNKMKEIAIDLSGSVYKLEDFSDGNNQHIAIYQCTGGHQVKRFVINYKTNSLNKKVLSGIKWEYTSSNKLLKELKALNTVA